MKLNKKKFDEHQYISCRKHPTLDLYIYNYTHECQFEKKWDEFTTMARGLVLDSEGNIISYPMKKFFNFSETEETKYENLPKETPNITIKEDGSMLSVFYYKGETVFATRGSFESDQAKWASEWWEQKHSNVNMKYHSNLNFIFECIYPENRIVIDYNGYRGLKMITIFDKDDPIYELSYKEMVNFAVENGFDFVYEKKVEHIRELLKIVDNLGQNEEGFVCRYSNGMRMKIKGGEYVKLHKLMTGMNNKVVWEYLSQNKKIEIGNIPDELYDWIRNEEKDLKSKFNEMKSTALYVYYLVSALKTRKEQAEYLLKNYKKYAPMVFTMLDKKSPDGLIWKLLEPEYKPFGRVQMLGENEQQ